MTISEIITALEEIAPLAYQESYDNAGLLTGSPQWECTGAICTLDATEAVLQEAHEKGCNLVVAHHPIVFKGISQITGKNYVEQAIIYAIKNDIAIYAIHTNLDNVKDGVNKTIANQLGLLTTKFLLPTDNQQVGSGMIGNLAEPITETAFLALLKKQFKLSVIKHTPLLNQKVSRVAVCGGSGSFLISAAKAAGAQFFISADIKYHEFFDAEDRLVVADIGHWESEQYTIDLLFSVLTAKFPNFAVLKTTVQTNPVRYFMGS